MTKFRNTGWEADRLYKSSVSQTFKTPSHPIVVTGYFFKLAMIPSDASLFFSNKSAQVLWHLRIDGLPADDTDDWGVPALVDATGTKQNLHGGGLANNILAVDILKASPWVYAVNDVLQVSGWRLLVPASCTAVMVAAHAGEGPVDFEVQGGIFYENPAAKP